MSSGLLLFCSLLYLAILFLVARWGERSSSLFKGKSGAWTYTLSLGVYCSAWTFYGSIGRASTHGLDFLAIYLGPVITFPIWWLLTKRMIRIVNTQHITSLSDLLASRYGKNQSVGSWVALMIIIAITPYISLQIKAIGDSFYALTSSQMPIWLNPVFVTTFILCVFTLTYGMRFLGGNHSKSGMVSVVAFESLLKLTVFLGAALWVIYGMFDGPSDIFERAADSDLAQIKSTVFLGDTADWFWMLIISGVSFIFLPRQFQMGVLENRDESHLDHALWASPLYLLLITLLVLPIALGGVLILSSEINPDFYLLKLAQEAGGNWLGGLVYFGGFSAATSMIIVSSLSLGNMLNTNLLLPAFLRLENNVDMSRRIVQSRRLSLIFIFVLAYLYYYFVAFDKPLVSTGLISFVGISQIAPALIGGLFWREATRKGALLSMFAGFAVWAYMLILPSLVHQHLENSDWLLSPIGPMGIAQGMGYSQLSAAIFLSLSINITLFIAVSLLTNPDRLEINQAEIFTRINRISRRSYDQAGIWKADVPFADIKSLLINFLGDTRTEEVLDRYARINRINFEYDKNADPRMISYAERLLTEAIGPASARIVIQSVAKGEEISVIEVIDILQESKEIFQLNRDLKAKTEELEEATEQLRKANATLQEYSEIKDEFLYTVTHELRTPLTAIRAQAELVADDPEMPQSDRQRFMDAMVKECERLTRLITNVLDLEKFESGSQKLSLHKGSMREVIDVAVNSVQQLIEGKNIQLSSEIHSDIPANFMDVDRIEQVVVNLLSNAIKYVEPHTGIITVTAYVLKNDIKVNVTDNGVGISSEDHSLIFDKFYQAKHQTRKKPKGTGLGLAICKNIIQMHNGRIWVDENHENGTRISFTIPLYINKELTEK